MQEQNELKARVLVADDSVLYGAMLVSAVRHLGCEPVLVASGLDAYLRVQEERFDLVLMDLEMPEMNGLEAAAGIRRLRGEQYQQLPIVALTAHENPAFREVCLNRGMTEFLKKPVSVEQLGELVTRLVFKMPLLAEKSRVSLDLESIG